LNLNTFAPITKMMRLTVFALVYTLLCSHITVPVEIPQDYFRSPVDIPVLLSGTFGEPRNTHFHAGIDIKTEGVEGKRIYAVADGYVSRIRIAPSGYGTSIFITHPNGYVSHYAHLQRFHGSIAQWARQKQYELKMFDVDLESIPPDVLPVNKGDIIAYSGNTGGSAGPHLHFEIRDVNDKVYNPLLFGYDKMFIDNIPPAVYNIFAYNLTDDRQFTSSKTIPIVALGGGKHKVTNTIKVNRNKIGLGVQTIDQQNGTHHKNGIYELKMYVNNALHFHFRIDEFTFDKNRTVFSHCDFWRRRGSNQIVHKCFREKGNSLNAYPLIVNNGVLNLTDDQVYNITIEVYDFHGNHSSIDVKVQRDTTLSFFTAQKLAYNETILQGKRNIIRRDNLEVLFPKESFFDDLYLNITVDSNGSPYSDYFHIHDFKTPVLGYFDIAIKPKMIDSALLEKYLIVYKNYAGKILPLGGVFDDGFLKTRSRDLGLHYITVDTVAPKISPHNIYNNKLMTGLRSIIIKAYDSLSGIREYDAFVNDQWVLLEYDTKSGTFYYHFDDKVQKGANTFEVIMSDACGNASTYSTNFRY
jgi:hypothetical protein